MKTIATYFISIYFLFAFSANAQGQWDLSGNSITTGDFLGTTNTEPLELRTDNSTTEQPILFVTNSTEERMRIDAGGNVGIGDASPAFLLDLGTGDLNLEDGIIRIGANAAVELNGTRNVFIGLQADAAIATGIDNTAIGDNAGESIAAGDDNTCIGSNAGALISSGERNTVVGAEAGQLITTGSNNVALGFECFEALTDGTFNTGFGTGAGRSLDGGSGNTLIGNTTGSMLTEGSFNTIIGYSAGNSLNSDVDNDNKELS